MKSYFIDKNIKYDGTQLRSLFAYLEYQILGNSIVSFIGPCDVSFEHMVDGEDLLAQSPIRGSEMLHFIVEIFDEKLSTAVSLQRLFASIAKDYISQKTNQKFPLARDGDDIFWEKKKLSISIATNSSRSMLIHFAMNISNEGTPVPTCALKDFGLSPTETAKNLMELFSTEFQKIQEATYKVKSVT
jgi:hypothetical protein